MHRDWITLRPAQNAATTTERTGPSFPGLPASPAAVPLSLLPSDSASHLPESRSLPAWPATVSLSSSLKPSCIGRLPEWPRDSNFSASPAAVSLSSLKPSSIGRLSEWPRARRLPTRELSSLTGDDTRAEAPAASRLNFFSCLDSRSAFATGLTSSLTGSIETSIATSSSSSESESGCELSTLNILAHTPPAVCRCRRTSSAAALAFSLER